jgi:hypothetical protein
MLRAAVKPGRDPRRTRSTQEPPEQSTGRAPSHSTPRPAYHRAPRTSQGCERRPRPGLSDTQSSPVISDSPASSMCVRTGGCTNDDGPARSRAPCPPAGAPRATQGDASPVTNQEPPRGPRQAGFRLLLWTISDSAMLSAAMRGGAVASRQTRQPAGAATPTIALDEKENAPYLASPREALGQNADGR